MGKKRRITITRETHELLVVRDGTAPRGWCEACAAESVMLPAEEAGVLLGIGARAVYRRVEDGRLHFVETPCGRVQVCLRSARSETHESTF